MSARAQRYAVRSAIALVTLGGTVAVAATLPEPSAGREAGPPG